MARMDVIGKTGPFTLARGGGRQVSNVRNLIARATSSSLDNLGSHKGAAVRDIGRAAGARLFFLPPYSPDQLPNVIGSDAITRRDFLNNWVA